MNYRALARGIGVRCPGNLATIFGPAFIRRLTHPSFLREILSESGLLQVATKLQTVGDVFDFSYAVLQNHYRCEYIYKNAIAAKILLHRHSHKTATLLTEVAVSECKADLVLINGTTVAYEIKTELDSLERLATQLQAYRRAFDKVYVVTHQTCADRLSQQLPEGVGLISLTNRYTLVEAKSAASNCNRIDPAVVFDILRRSEYVAVVRRHFGFVPDVPNTLIYSACRELFLRLSRPVIQAELANALKCRGAREKCSETIDLTPHSLKLHAVTGGVSAQHTRMLLKSPQDIL